MAACSLTRPVGCRLRVFGFLVHSLDQAARMQKAALGQAPEERGNDRFPGARLRCAHDMRMVERVDTRNCFCARCAGNQTAFERILDLFRMRT